MSKYLKFQAMIGAVLFTLFFGALKLMPLSRNQRDNELNETTNSATRFRDRLGQDDELDMVFRWQRNPMPRIRVTRSPRFMFSAEAFGEFPEYDPDDSDEPIDLNRTYEGF